jgi:CO/xanthine dehydrogenase FAD-binding subunit
VDVKPAPFEYVAPRSVPEAVEALAGEGAWVLAGGQSLVPLLNLREVRPSRVVDINGAGLGVIRRRDGVLHLGAAVRQAALLRSSVVAERWPLLAEAVRHVGHAATRSRGTVGGSVVHGDPRAQLPAVLAALDAGFEYADKLLVSIVVPPLPAGARTAYAEFARTRGVFPDAGAAVVLAPGEARIALLGTGRATRAEAAVRAGASAREAAELAADEVEGDHHRALVADVTRRALERAGRR